MKQPGKADSSLKMIRDTAYSMGFSESSLRNYERMGVIRPRKNERSGYRYYDQVDVSRVMTCRKYRGFGFTIPQALALIDEAGPHDVVRALNDKKAALERALTWQACLLEDLEYTAGELTRCVNNEKLMSVERLPEICYVESLVTVGRVDKAHRQAINQMTAHIPLSKVGYVSSVADDGERDIRTALTMRSNYMTRLGIPVTPHTKTLAPGLYATMYMCSTRTERFTNETLQYMQGFARERGFVPGDTLVMETITSLERGDSLAAYRKFHLKIDH